MNRFWIGFAAALGLLAIAGAITIAGAYDVAATSAHTRPVAWALDTTMANSVERRSSSGDAPVAGPEAVRNGFVHYRTSCVVCHGAPGRNPEPWTRQMLPSPPALSIAVTHWEPGELYWILQHGIKMSGMPSFAALYSERQLWEIVAFLKSDANVDAARYAALERELGGIRSASALDAATPTVGTPQAGAIAAGAAAEQRAEQGPVADRPATMQPAPAPVRNP